MSATRSSRWKRRSPGWDREKSVEAYRGSSSSTSLRNERYGMSSSLRNELLLSRNEGYGASDRRDEAASFPKESSSVRNERCGVSSSPRNKDSSLRNEFNGSSSSSLRNGRREDYLSSRNPPSGLIFMCNSITKRDCFHFKVFGLPYAKKDLVEEVVPGTFLFLYDFDVKRLYGVYEAVSQGGLNLEPKAFHGQGSYPSQVRFDVYRECLPLTEDKFKEAIRENYYARNKFSFELSSIQVDRLLKLFCPIEPARKRINRGMDRNDSEPLPRPCLLDRRDTGATHLERLPRDAQDRLPPQSLLKPTLGDRRTAGLVHLDLVQCDALQHRLPPQGLRIEDRVLRQDPHLAVDFVEATYLPQIKVLDGRADRGGLLNQGRMNEVDELALKYLQQGQNLLGLHSKNFTALLSEDGLVRNGLISNFQQDVMSRDEHDALLRAQHSTTLKAEHDITLRAHQSAALRAQHDASLRAQHDIALRGEHDTQIRAQHTTMLNAEHDIALRARALEAEGLRSAASSRIITRDLRDALKAQRDAALRVSTKEPERLRSAGSNRIITRDRRVADSLRQSASKRALPRRMRDKS